MNATSQTAVLVLLLAMLTADDATAQLSWIQRSPQVAPPSRSWYAMAYDSQRGVTVLFGGEGLWFPAGGFQSDTWEWDGSAWAQRTPATSPSPRAQHSMAYDSQRGRVVMFGGITSQPFPGGSLPLQDTWEWDGTNWTQVQPANPPAARCGHSMTFVASTGQVIMHGGSASGTPYFNDSWAWNGANWLQVQVGGMQNRLYAGLTFDATNGNAILFGGFSPPSGQLLGDTWRWNGTFWQQAQPPQQPSPRGRPMMAFDTWRSRVLLHGGVDTNGSLSDTWAWNNTTWSTLTTPTSPSPMDAGALVFDSMRGMAVLLGRNQSTMQMETWEAFEPVNTASAIAYGTGCGAPTPTLSPHAGSRPIIGQTHVSDITNAYLGIAFVAWGFSDQFWGSLALPVALDPLGFVGCQLWQSGDGEIGSGCTSTSWTTARHSFPIPLLPALDGASVYLQAWTLNPTYNPAGIVLSNAVALHLGGQ